MSRLYNGEWNESLASRFLDELPKENVEYKEIIDQNDNEIFEFNQDINYEEGIRSPGWARLQKNKMKRIK